jgi:hypothetical protein
MVQLAGIGLTDYVPCLVIRLRPRIQSPPPIGSKEYVNSTGFIVFVREPRFAAESPDEINPRPGVCNPRMRHVVHPSPPDSQA